RPAHSPLRTTARTAITSFSACEPLLNDKWRAMTGFTNRVSDVLMRPKRACRSSVFPVAQRLADRQQRPHLRDVRASESLGQLRRLWIERETVTPEEGQNSLENHASLARVFYEKAANKGITSH